MHVNKGFFTAAAVAALFGCSQAAPQEAAPSPHVQPTPSQAAPVSAVATENDRVCKSMYGIPCDSLIHMLGPLNAELRKETRACVQETVSVYVSGEWLADNKYQNPKTGERYGDHCIAVSL